MAQAAVVDPSLSEAYFNLGAMYQNLKKPWLAQEAFREALALRPDWDLAHKGLWRTHHDDMAMYDSADGIGREAVAAGVWKHFMQFRHEGDLVFQLHSSAFHDTAKIPAAQILEDRMDELVGEAAMVLASLPQDRNGTQTTTQLSLGPPDNTDTILDAGDWGETFVLRDGKVQPEGKERLPETTEILLSLPEAATMINGKVPHLWLWVLLPDYVSCEHA